VKVDGHRAVRSLVIAPEAFEGRDADLLADMIMAAITEAQRRLDDHG
jgi:DNA-binding protein YbaB